MEFTLFEEAGCVLPYYDLIFKFKIPEIRNYLVENNKLIITLGHTKEDMETLPFRVFQKSINKHGQGYWIAEVHGFYDAVPFLQETGTGSYKGNSIDVLKTTTSKYFKFETNVVKDDSSQTWLRCRKTLRDFVTDVWLHSNIPNSFMGVTITKDGRFIAKDMVKTIKSKPDWVFSFQPKKSNEVLISGQPEILNDTGMVNTLTQNKKTTIYDMDKGTHSEFILERVPLLANTSDIEKNTSNLKDSINYWKNSNVHDKYWESYSRNLGLLTFFSGVRAVVSYVGKLVDRMQVLDVAFLLDQNSDNPHESEGLYSGKYLISKIVRHIGSNKNLQTHVILSRESLNEVRDVVKEELAQQPQVVQNDEEHTKGSIKLNNTLSRLKTLLNIRGFKLNIPSISILSNLLAGIVKDLFGFDLSNIWLNLEYVLGLSENSLLLSLLKLIFQFLTNSGECKYLDNNSSIMNDINSGMFNINNGVLDIPNIGTTKITSEEYTSNVFSWYVSGIISLEEDSLVINPDSLKGNTTTMSSTGDPNIDRLLKDTIIYLNNEGIVNPLKEDTFRRYWGSSNKEGLDLSDIKGLYSELSNNKYFNKIISGKSNYIYILYPEYVQEGILKIDGKVYNNYELVSRDIPISNISQSYYIYRTKDKFNNNVNVEIL